MTLPCGHVPVPGEPGCSIGPDGAHYVDDATWERWERRRKAAAAEVRREAPPKPRVDVKALQDRMALLLSCNEVMQDELVAAHEEIAALRELLDSTQQRYRAELLRTLERARTWQAKQDTRLRRVA